jgi:hypothetical protein
MAHPLDLRVVGEPVRIVGSTAGWKNAPVTFDGAAATVLRPSSILGFVVVWIEARQRARQIHVSCLTEF